MTAEVTPLRTPDATPEPPSDQLRVNGVFDIPSPGRVAGWAIDRADPGAAVEVEIWREGVLVGTVRADRYREDLERGGIGTGRYGFAMELDPPLAPGLAFTVIAHAVTGDGITGPLRPTGGAQPSGDPTTRLIERTFSDLGDLGRKLDQLETRMDATAAQADPEALTNHLERIELVQIRLEQAMSAREPRQIEGEVQGLRLMARLALLVGIAALGTGLYSIFGG